jgi:hypothetical protein
MHNTAIAGVRTLLRSVKKKAGPRKPIDCMIYKNNLQMYISEIGSYAQNFCQKSIQEHTEHELISSLLSKKEHELTLRTFVTETPFATRVSAIQPPIFANTAIVSHGKTHKSPDSVRLNFRT